MANENETVEDDKADDTVHTKLDNDNAEEKEREENNAVESFANDTNDDVNDSTNSVDDRIEEKSTGITEKKDRHSEDSIPNNFLNRFSNLSKSINSNPAVVRAGIVLQSASSAGVFPTKLRNKTQDLSSESNDSSFSEDSEESEESDDSKLSEDVTRRNMAEIAASTAAAVKTSTVASASAAASSSVASGFRGRYAIPILQQFSSPQSSEKSPPTFSTPISNSDKNAPNQTLNTPKVSSATNSNLFLNNKSPGKGIFNALSKRRDQIIANVKATPSPATQKVSVKKPIGTQSQTALILNSSAGAHMQKILSSLEEGEYVMFLGPGFMGVNLKQSFLKRHGVYIDYIVPNGAADKSGVVSVGDCLLKVGSIDVTHGTIRNVPNIIAQADRPVIIVLKRDFHVTGGPMDVAIGKVLQVQQAARSGTTGGQLLSHLPLVDKNISQQNDETGENKHQSESNDKKEKDVNNEAKDDPPPPPPNDSQSQFTPKTKNIIDESSSEENGSTSNSVHKKSSSVKTYSYHRQNSNLNKLPSPSKSVRASLSAYANKRSNEMSSFAALSRAASHDAEFRDIITCAFYACCIDARCLSFVAAHFSGEDNYDYYSESNGIIHSNDQKISSPKSSSSPPTSSIRLMLYLEILSFEELFGVTPEQRHRCHARRIAHKFLIPAPITAGDSSTTESYSPPMFDLRSALAPSILHTIAKKISDESTHISRDLFDECKSHIQESLCGNRFANFLISNECARMRAYLRGTSHFRHIPIEDLWCGLKAKDPNACNYFAYAILHFVCWTDESNESISLHRGKAINGVCAALYIQRDLLDCIKNYKDNKEELIKAIEHLWEIFLAPHGGMLDSITHSNECQEALEKMRSLIMNAAQQPYVVKALLSEEITSSLTRLAEELLYDYAVNIHQKFKESSAHELVCYELQNHQKDSYDGIPTFPRNCITRLVRKSHFPDNVSTHKPRKSVKDLISKNKNDDKIGITHSQKFIPETDSTSRSLAHQLDEEAANESTGINNVDDNSDNNDIEKNNHETNVESVPPNLEQVDPTVFNADFAIVFGSDDTAASISHTRKGSKFEQLFIKRFATVPLGALKEANIPATLESYAVVPPIREKATRFRTCTTRISDDGWEASLVNYIVPNPSTDNPNRSIYGVSLVLHQRDHSHVSPPSQNSPAKNAGSLLSASPTKTGTNQNYSSEADEGMVVFDDQGSPLFKKSPVKMAPVSTMNRVSDNIRQLLVSAVTPDFSRQLVENKWSQTSRRGGNTIGISLISSRNVIPSMRSTMSQFFDALTKYNENDEESSNLNLNGRCFAPLADILGNMSFPNVNKDDLRRMLQPYLQAGSKPWIDRPLSSQKDHFEAGAGKELLQSIPPIPLALIFIAALLEQKIIFSSTRRSVLLSACNAVTNLLQPIEWSHLLVPLVPSALAADLIEYPAPYIIGIPSDDPQSMSLLNKSLPPEVTLVDLDVGRVILASSFANESNKVNATSTLRSQMLRLAETLGDLFGEKLSEESWLCDDPFPPCNTMEGKPLTTPFQRIKDQCNDFITELLTGTNSCCYWIEEHSDDSTNGATVLFDEDRFLLLKNLREQGHYMPLTPERCMKNSSKASMLGYSNHLSLSMEDFDVILKSFLRTQGMSTHISSLPKESMAFY